MSSPQTKSNRTDEEALAWATRLDAGLTPADRAALESWLARDPAHAWRLAHFRQFYAQLHGTVPGLLREGRVAPAAMPAVSAVRSRRRRWAATLAAAAAVAVGVFFFATRPQEEETEIAQRRTLALADGSRADLNARTEVAIRLRGSERLVALRRGEAYFEVAKDPARPFLVETAAGVVRVTGTHFNVRATPPGALEVTVLEGAVAVTTGRDGGSREFKLQADDQLAIEGGVPALRHLPRGAAEDLIAWRDGKIAFADTPLAVAIERFADYHGRQLTVAAEVGGLPLSGRFTLDDLDAFLAAVEKLLPVRVLRGDGGTVRLVGEKR